MNTFVGFINKKEEIGVMGMGEVGKAVCEIYGDKDTISTCDVDYCDNMEKIKVLHVCIPYSESFHQTVKSFLLKYNPMLTYIHSTVEPLTTKKLISETQKIIVHTPIRGIHPHLYDGIMNFINYVGCESISDGHIAARHLTHYGIKAHVSCPSVNTELGKLMSTTYYGLCISYHNEMKKWCKHFGADFSIASTHFNQTYNKGYTKLGRINVVRPILSPPKDEKIGGHCIIPNAEILQKTFKDSPFLKSITDLK